MIGEVTVGVKYRMVDIVITLQKYTKYWKGCRENTSSSVSGINFGYRKAAPSINEVAELQEMLTHVAFQLGTPITRWCKGLHVILKNIPGNINMEKQRAILLI